jgi:hypothetical protein
MALAVFVPVHGAIDGSSISLPSPRLMLTTRMPSGARWVSTQSRPAAMSDQDPPPEASSTFTATISASGATPGPAARLEVMTPETWVPWPSSSSAFACVVLRFGQQPRFGDGWLSQKHCCATRSSARCG